ncbi:MBL fold metallo-hydrolase [Bacillus carboniphilus]|uniref:MBL fold metallo-hydrolase n=1 Tax=Bacillus carboniphilus TaxID=86663 RepID=A0ABP3FYP0_9BACI
MPIGTNRYIHSLQVYKTGECYQRGKLADQMNSWKKTAFPSLIFTFEHPTEGTILFDTGYDSTFFDVTDPFPYTLYRLLTPVKLENSFSFETDLPAVNAVFLSHFHADHVGGYHRFSNKVTFCSKWEWTELHGKKGVSAVKKAFIPELIPKDTNFTFIEDRNHVRLPEELYPFTEGYDLFGDSLMFAVHLPGHTNHQYGLFLKLRKKWVLLCADASWSFSSIQHQALPHPIAKLVIEGWSAYKNTFNKLHKLTNNNQELLIFPSHCEQSYQRYKEALYELDK